MKEGKGISQRTHCITNGHRQQCGDGQREGRGDWMEVGEEGKMGSTMVSIIKIK